MKSSHIITLFSEQPPPHTTPSSFMVSILIHCAGFGLLLMNLMHSPRINQSVMQRYTVRLFNAPRIETQRRRSVSSSSNTSAQSATQSIADDLPQGAAPASLPSVPEQLTQLISQPRTLVQPDAPPNLLLPQETPIPLLLMWSPENSPSKTIVPPPPQEMTVANVRPSLVRPNYESELADLNISSTRFPADTPTMPASTSPLVVRGPESVKQVPQTAADQLQQPTPALVMSLSDVQSQGPVIIPLANQGSKAATSESLAPPRVETVSENGSNPAAKQNGVGAGDGSGEQRSIADSRSGSGPQASAKSGADQASVSGANLGGEPTVVHITLPKDGQFGVVVVGSSLAEQYPETVGIWSGRLVYTVYLHIGLGKNWILQYSVPRSEEAAASGNITRPEAPWPYDILRPHLTADDFTSEAIMIHGFVNLAGQFERLAMVLPTQFAQAKFLLDALKHWQFRPARQNGQAAAVEVLLIIPEEVE